MKLELVSFNLCPYVQRSVITLNIKKAPYKITYIELDQPPKWFEKISPLGKVPLLKVGGKTVLFESAVINEYVDETVGKPLHPKDPLRKAYERAWIEYGSELLGQNYMMTMETDEAKLKELMKEFFTDLGRLEKQVSTKGPYFRGKDFSLVDSSFAPLFMRLSLSERLMKDPAWKKMPRVRKWAQKLVDHPAVQNSVIPEFPQLYREYCQEAGSLLF